MIEERTTTDGSWLDSYPHDTRKQRRTMTLPSIIDRRTVLYPLGRGLAGVSAGVGTTAASATTNDAHVVAEGTDGPDTRSESGGRSQSGCGVQKTRDLPARLTAQEVG